MAYADLNERAVVALVSRLTNSLNANIDLVNANTTANSSRNQTQIAYPQLILDAPPVPAQLRAFPIVAVADGPMTFEDDVGWGATGVYEVYAMVYEMDTDPEALAWKLRRQLQALVTTVTLSRNMDGGAWGLIIKKIIPGQRLTKMDPNSRAPQFMQYAAICVTLKDEQNYP